MIIKKTIQKNIEPQKITPAHALDMAAASSYPRLHPGDAEILAKMSADPIYKAVSKKLEIAARSNGVTTMTKCATAVAEIVGAENKWDALNLAMHRISVVDRTLYHPLRITVIESKSKYQRKKLLELLKLHGRDNGAEWFDRFSCEREAVYKYWSALPASARVITAQPSGNEMGGVK